MGDATSRSWNDLLESLNLRDGTGSVEISPDWAQGRAAFGGLVAALGIRGMRHVAPEDRRLRSAMISFVGPVAPGELRVEARLLRSGRSATQIEARLMQADETKCVVLGAYGSDRESVVQVSPSPAPTLTDVETLPDLPFIPGITPTFTQHFAFRWSSGAIPYTGASEPGIEGWCRFRDGSGPLDEEKLAGLVDAWPAPVIGMLRAPKPASSMTWTLDFIREPEGDAGDWWMYASQADAASGGYARCHSNLWDRQGRLVACGTQLVTVFG